jgi:hypothetical protein
MTTKALTIGTTVEDPTSVTLVRCRIDNTEFKPQFIETGFGPCIECPSCGRGYIYKQETKEYYADNALIILKTK